jgi:hypothetical protein
MMTTQSDRLIHIKQLFLRAESLAERRDDVSLILLIQQLDFIVETFLKLVIDTFPKPTQFAPPQTGYYTNIKDLETSRYKSDMDFHRAWDEVVGRLRDIANGINATDLPLRRDMNRLHDIRNDVQHKGAIPNPKDIVRYLPLVESFLRDSYQQIFATDFDTLSALSFIKHTQLKEPLEKAHDALGLREWTKAVCEAAIAFNLLLQMAKKLAHPESLDQIYRKVDEVHRTSDGTRLDFLSDGQRQAIGGIVNEVSRLREHVAVVGLGLDYSEYVSIKPLLPKVRWGKYDDGRLLEEWDVEIPNGWSDELNQWVWKAYTEAEARKVVTFVERQILRVQATGALDV